MKGYWLIPLSICFTGCMVSNGLQYEAASEVNMYHIARVRKGMSERQVLQIMHKPYSYESFEVQDDIYDVWFYVTRVTGLDQTRMVPQNLTPLTFKNGVLVGTGYSWYYFAMKGQADEVAAQRPEEEKPKTQQEEDVEFEKALKSTIKPQAAPADANPIQKTPTKGTDQKLPPNVHIISSNEVASCAPCPKKVCGPNRFSILSKGMSETQVVNIVGEPIKFETFEMGSDVYDVWFYEAVASKSGKPSIVPQNLVPLTFKNAVLISMSDEEFYRIKQQAVIAAAQAPEAAVEVPTAEPTFFKPFVPKTPLGVTSKVFSKVRKGMSEEEVMNLIGPTMDQESLSSGYDIYDVWFYDVAAKKNGAPQKVPLTFKNGILVGTTVDEYNKVKSQAVPAPAPVDDDKDKIQRMQEDESEQNFNYW
jgi:outer membrane protein assembly factor BamE (lipoprotein component of BamABCDE complex)